jgi:2-haloacid dehalogenase/putative hydrolase of the HAD superfamily
MERPMKLSDFKALTFDCYGTLIDWEPGMIAHLQPWAKRNGVQMSDAALLETYSKGEHALEKANPGMLYPDILAGAHKELAKTLKIPVDEKAARAFGDSIGDWEPFADSTEALAYLKKHYKLVILSNVNNAGVAKSAAKMGNPFDDIITAEQVGSYKPVHNHFHEGFKRLKKIGVEKHQILHTAQSLFHDHIPANELGIHNAWIDRRAKRGGGAGATVPVGQMPKLDFRFESMAEFVEAHKKETGG